MSDKGLMCQNLRFGVLVLIFAVIFASQGQGSGVSTRNVAPQTAESGPLPVPAPLLCKKIGLYFPIDKNSQIYVVVVRTAALSIDSLVVSYGDQNYKIDGAELSYLAEPLLDDITISVENVGGEKGVTLTIPYFDKVSPKLWSTLKYSYITIHDMRRHTIVK